MNKQIAIFCSLLALLVSWLFAGAAQAGTDAELRQLYRKSRKNVVKGRYGKAEVHLQTGIILLKRTLKQGQLSSSARAHYRKGLFRFSIALAVTYYRFMKQHSRAYDVLEALRKEPLTNRQRKVYKSHMRKIAPQVKASIVLSTSAPNAMISLVHPAGWKAKSKAPLRSSLWPGKWRVTITTPGQPPFQLNLHLKPGGFLKRHIRLLSRQSKEARLALYSTPARANITLSHPQHGSCRGQTPLYVKLSPGTWQIRAKHPKHKHFQGQIEIAANHTMQRTLVMQPTSANVKWAVAWGSLSTAIVFGGTGILLTYFAQKEFKDIQTLEDKDKQAEFQARYRTAVGMQIWGYVTFGLASAGLITSGVLFTHILLQPKANALHPTQPPRQWNNDKVSSCQGTVGATSMTIPQRAPQSKAPVAPRKERHSTVTFRLFDMTTHTSKRSTATPSNTHKGKLNILHSQTKTYLRHVRQ